MTPYNPYNKTNILKIYASIDIFTEILPANNLHKR